jgi:hypothetical protein
MGFQASNINQLSSHKSSPQYSRDFELTPADDSWTNMAAFSLHYLNEFLTSKCYSSKHDFPAAPVNATHYQNIPILIPKNVTATQ